MMPPRDVLIVDDEPDMADVIKAALEHEGYPCRVAANGRQALDEVSAALPGLVLLDMLMPIMNGWETARVLRDTYGPDLPIVVMTAAEHAGSRRDEAAADDVLAKPFELDELLRVIASFLPPPARGEPREEAPAG